MWYMWQKVDWTMLAIMMRKFHERNPLKGKALDFENLISKVYKCVYCPKGFWHDIARENSDRSQWSKWSFRNKILIFALMRNSYYSVTFHHHWNLKYTLLILKKNTLSRIRNFYDLKPGFVQYLNARVARYFALSVVKAFQQRKIERPHSFGS